VVERRVVRRFAQRTGTCAFFSRCQIPMGTGLAGPLFDSAGPMVRPRDCRTCWRSASSRSS
jgi:hypothetical protein